MEKVATERYLISRSEFYFLSYKVDSETDFKEEFRKLKTETYPHADHYLYAYRIDEKGVIKEGFTENGEPVDSSRKMLFNLQANRFKNIALVAVRYFGGKKLGAANLEKVFQQGYKNVLSKALENA